MKKLVRCDTYLTELDSSYAVAELVKRRRPQTDAHDVGYHQNDDARDSRLARQSNLYRSTACGEWWPCFVWAASLLCVHAHIQNDTSNQLITYRKSTGLWKSQYNTLLPWLHSFDTKRQRTCRCYIVRSAHIEGELSAVVVHAARVHETERIPDGLAREHLFASHRTQTAIGHGCSDDGGRLTRHFHRTQLQQQVKHTYVTPFWRHFGVSSLLWRQICSKWTQMKCRKQLHYVSNNRSNDPVIEGQLTSTIVLQLKCAMQHISQTILVHVRSTGNEITCLAMTIKTIRTWK